MHNDGVLGTLEYIMYVHPNGLKEYTFKIVKSKLSVIFNNQVMV